MVAFVPILRNFGKLTTVHFTLAIVGSRKQQEYDDFGNTDWQVLAPNLTIYGFDADAAACEQANQQVAHQSNLWQENHIPLALSDRTGRQALYLTADPQCSSLYPPNIPFVDRLLTIGAVLQLRDVIEVATTTLDEFCQSTGITTIDYLQVDVQGADLSVLQGASRLLKQTVLGIQSEVEFVPLYRGQPLFGDLDRFLRQQHFSLFDLVSLYRYPRARSPVRAIQRGGQLLWGDAIYFKDLLSDETWATERTPEQLLKLACLADILGFPDYTLELLEHLTLIYGDRAEYNFADCIVQVLAQFPELVAQGLENLPVMANISPWLTV